MLTVYSMLLFFVLSILSVYAQLSISQLLVCSKTGNKTLQSNSLCGLGLLQIVQNSPTSTHSFYIRETAFTSPDALGDNIKLADTRYLSLIKGACLGQETGTSKGWAHRLPKNIINCTSKGANHRYLAPKLSATYSPGAQSFHYINKSIVIHGLWTPDEEYCFRKTYSNDRFGPYYITWSLSYICTGTIVPNYDTAEKCKIEVRGSGKMASITVTDKELTEGSLTAISGHHSATVHCEKMPCILRIEIEDELSVVCPSGFKKEYVMHRDIAENCPLAAYENFRGAAIHICRSTAWPKIFWVLLVAIVAGQWILLVLNWTLVYAYALFKKCFIRIRLNQIKKALTRIREDPEAVYEEVTEPLQTVCNFCDEPYTRDDFTKVLHNHCSEHRCPYCDSDFSFQTSDGFKRHVSTCNKKSDTMEVALAASGKLIDDWRTIINVNRITQWQWVSVIVILLLWTIAPAYGAPSNDTMIEDDPFMVYTSTTLESLSDLVQYNCETTCPIEYGKCICHSGYSYEMASDGVDHDLDQQSINRVAAKGYVHPHLNYQRNNAITWAGISDLNEDTMVLDGTFLGYLKANENDEILFIASHPNTKATKEVKVRVQKYVVKYKFVPKSYIYDRKFELGNDWSCQTCNPPDSRSAVGFDNDDTDSKVIQLNGVNAAGQIPGWCWSPNKGCMFCGARANLHGTSYIIVQGTASEPTIQATICVSVTGMTTKCSIISEAGTIDVDGEVKIIVSQLPTDSGQLRDGKTVYTYLNKLSSGAWYLEGNKPLFITELIPDVMPATHGYIGDTYSSDLLPVTDPAKGRLISNLDTVQFTHILTAWSNPRCNFAMLRTDMTHAFENVLLNQDGRSPRIDLVTSSLQMRDDHVNGEFEIKVKSTTDMTIAGEIKGMTLAITSPKLKSVKLTNAKCSGVINTLEGFRCNLTVTDIDVSQTLNIRLTSSTDHIVLADNSFTLSKGQATFDASVSGVALMQASKIVICITGFEICTDAVSTLKKKMDYTIVKKETATVDHTQDSGGACSGISWFTCAGSSIGNFFSNIWSSFSYIKWIIILIVVSILFFVVLKAFFYFYNRCRKDETKQMVEKIDKKLAELDEDTEFDENKLRTFLLSDVKPKNIIKKVAYASKEKISDKTKPAIQALTGRLGKIKSVSKKFMNSKQE